MNRPKSQETVSLSPSEKLPQRKAVKANPKKKSKRSKNPKTTPQVILLKYFYQILEASANKKSVVDAIQEHTGFSQRQIYKWMWDEALRNKQRSDQLNEYFRNENLNAFKETLNCFNRNFGHTSNYLLHTVFVPKITSLSSENNQLVWRTKLKAINNDVILMKKHTKIDGIEFD